MPRIVDHAQRRTEIVQALWQVIYERGIDGVSFRTVAAATGVSIGRVQHYFASKDELVLEGCRQMVAAAWRDHGPGRQGPGDHGPASAETEPRRAREALLALLRGPVPADEDFRRGAAVWATYQAKAVSDPAIAVVVTEALGRRVELLAALLAAARGLPGDGVGGDAPGEVVGDAPDGEADGGAEGAAGSTGQGTDASLALLLASVSEGLAQRVLVGALDAAEATRLIEADVDRILTG